MPLTGHLPAAPSRFGQIRLGGTLALAAVLFASQALFGDRLSVGSIAHAQSAATVAARPAGQVPVVLWREPDHARDLFYGPGGRDHQPDARRAFTFIREDLTGSHPKFEIRDADGVRWIAKLGTEAKPETVATRLVWGAGYEADEDYFIGEIRVDGLPARLHRGRRLLGANGIVRDVRLKRESDDRDRVGGWAWRQNRFSGTRELNGLRVLMAVIDNWDLKDVNNAIYQIPADGERERIEHVYEVKDLGSSFGSTGLERTDRPNGNLHDYQKSSFITRVTPDTVSFETPRRPDWIVFFNAPQYFKRLGLLWIGKNIPRSDARWMGHVLSEIPPDQIRAAFRAAIYTPDEVEGFATVLEARIQQLNGL